MSQTPSHRYLLGLGSNLGDRAGYLAQATSAISQRLGSVIKQSATYETTPLGAADQTFLNAALICSSSYSPDEVLEATLNIEKDLGRIRRERWGNRIIDIDLLLWLPASAIDNCASAAYQSASLTVPHPHLLVRDFALVPAASIAPEWLHPISKRTLGQELVAKAYKLTPLPTSL